MLDQKLFGEKLRNHRKKLGMTQEEVADKIGVSPQAISKWESGDCLPDCFNLKALSTAYNISADFLLETELNGDIDTISNKIEQLSNEFIWATVNSDRYSTNTYKELGDDLWEMWKSIYFAEIADRELQQKRKAQGDYRIAGAYGTKIWDDDGVACVIKSSLISSLSPFDQDTAQVMHEICSEEGQKLLISLRCDNPVTKQELIDKTKIDISRLNELLILFTENRIIEFVDDNGSLGRGYLICGHCGIVAYMILAAMYLLNKQNNYTVTAYMYGK